MKSDLLFATISVAIGVIIGSLATVYWPVNTEPEYHQRTALISWENDEELLQDMFEAEDGSYTHDVLGLYRSFARDRGIIYAPKPKNNLDMFVLGHECLHAFYGRYHE